MKPLCWALCLVACVGCASVGPYLSHRAWDFTDIVDVKYGTALGLGAKVEATMYLGLGLGIADQPRVREWFGRLSDERENGGFAYFLLGGGEGAAFHGTPGLDSFHVLLVDVFLLSEDSTGGIFGGWPSVMERWRFGGEVLIPFAQFGLYLNVGELVDFTLGLAGLDIAEDDGVSKWLLVSEQKAKAREQRALEWAAEEAASRSVQKRTVLVQCGGAT